MYSRDLFPKYPPETLTIPGNYSGSAFRSRGASGSLPQIPPQPPSQSLLHPLPEVPPRPDLPAAVPTPAVTAVPGSAVAAPALPAPPALLLPPSAPEPGLGRDFVTPPRSEEEAPGGRVRPASEPGASESTASDTVTAPAGETSETGSQLVRLPSRPPFWQSPALSPFLPPKPTLPPLFSGFGLEELLLLGVVLLLSQTDDEDDTLLLLALLFLYK